VKDDNCVDKEYEEANEWGVVVRRWICVFCWSRKTISYHGIGRPYYLASGRVAGGRNQH
jgi:hypothetical protein